MVSSDFTEKAEAVKKLPNTPSDEEMLQLYALYKQANSGDNETHEPMLINFVNKKKWLAWKAHSGKSKEDAEKEYIALVDKLSAQYNK